MSNAPAFPSKIARNCWHCPHRVQNGTMGTGIHFCKQIVDDIYEAGFPLRLFTLGWNGPSKFVQVDPDRETDCPQFEQMDYAEVCAKYGKDYADELGGKQTWG